MPYAQNDLVEVAFTWHDTRFEGVQKNVLHFRVHEGTMPDDQQIALLNGIAEEWSTRWRSCLSTNTSLVMLKVTNKTQVSIPTDQRTWADGDWPGFVATDLDDLPHAAVCVVRKSYTRGRKGIGRVFVGPLPDIFTDAARIVPDPTGIGDLQILMDNLGDPIALAGCLMRPVVVSGTATSAAANNDVRSHALSPLTVYMRSRRPGIGE